MKRLIYISLVYLASSVATEIYSQSLREYKLPINQVEKFERFGSTISIDGNYVCIGAPEYNEFKGTAFIYEWNGESWVESGQLNSSDGVEGDEFGKSVGINGEYAIVGAKMERTEKPGAAYIFKKDGSEWIEKQKIVPSDGQKFNEFDYSVALSNNFAIIGAWKQNAERGAVYIFKKEIEEWTETQKFSSSVAYRFGEVLTANEEWLFVGAPKWMSAKGSIYAYKFEQTEWVIKDTIFAEDGDETYIFGTSISFDGEFLLSIAGNNAAFLFGNEGDKWVQNVKIETEARAVAINLPFMVLGNSGEG